MYRPASSFIQVLALFFVGFLLIHCQRESSGEGLLLPAAYTGIDTLTTIADCVGPNGAYTTEVRSSRKGYGYFAQHYTDGRSPYIARAMPDQRGYAYDTLGNVTDTLSREVVAIIRGHEIHRMFIDPLGFWEEVTFRDSVIWRETDYARFVGQDVAGNPVDLYYHAGEQRLDKVVIRNPMDTTEQIEMIPIAWEETGYGPMVNQLLFVQDGRDTFRFDYREVRVNE